MKELDLETAGDFVAMAATLIQIKSQMLLPQYNENGELLEIEDPRKELVSRLLEYQRFQDAAKQLYAKPLLGRDQWIRGVREELPQDEDESDIVIEDGGLFALISHYRRAIRNIKKTVHRVALKAKSIASQIMLIKDRLIVGQQVVLKDLINKAEDFRSETLITFLSALELGKMGLVTVFQAEVYGDIYLTAKRTIDASMLERVQEYNSLDAEQVADQIFEQAQEDASLEVPVVRLDAEDSEQETVATTSSATDDDILQAEQELNIERDADV
jgi:segregation and condensation protein A